MRSSRQASPGSSQGASIRTRRRRVGSSGFARPASRRSSTTVSRPVGRTRPGGPGKALARPFVTYKVATTLDGRVTVPGSALGHRRGLAPARPRAARRLGRRGRRHGNRARRCAAPRRAGCPGRAATTPPRFRSRPAPCRVRPRAPSGPTCRGARGLLPPTASSRSSSRVARRWRRRFWKPTSIDKLLVFVAPTLAGAGQRFLDELPGSTSLSHLSARPVGEDVLLEAYVHAP